ncbi:MAG: FecR domain-containing protein [Niabella sp.]
MTEQRFKLLLNGWLEQSLSQSEIDEFLDEIGQGKYHQILENRLDEDFLHFDETDKLGRDSRKQMLLEKLLLLTEKEAEEKVIPLKRSRRLWMGWAAAAVTVGVVISFIFIYNNKKHGGENELVAIESGIPYPSHNAAVITLPDQTRIRVDTITGTIILDKYGIKISKLPNGEIAYISMNNAQPVADIQAVITNPRGSRPLSVRLSDNTVVWLNAESSLQYPVVFGNDARDVRLSGEGYFEVAKDPERKFLVHTDKLTTEVLGTHFNVRSYNKDGKPSVTLLEGSVSVVENQTNKRITLKPNQQAQLVENLRIASVSNADDIVAWKGGLLSFVDADVETILENMGRAYNVDFQLSGPVSAKQYSGTISKNTSLTELLQIISAITGVQFKQQDKTIIVTQ